WAYVYIETYIGITCCDDFSATVVPVLSHFCNHDAWPAAFDSCKGIGQLLSLFKTFVIFHLFAVYAAKGFYLCFITAENEFERSAYFTQCRTIAGSVYRKFQ